MRQGLPELHNELAFKSRVTFPGLTFKQRQVLRRIGNAATPLWQRIPTASTSDDTRRLERWCKVLGSRQLLERRMRSVPGTTAESVLSGSSRTRLPDWTRTLGKILFECRADPSAQLPGVPFNAILWPFLLHARRRFHAEAGSSRSVLSPSAVEDIERELVEHLSLVASLALGHMFYEFRFMRAPFAAFEEIWTLQARSTVIYSDFVEHLLRNRLLELFERYPVLGRLLARSVDLWVKASAQMCRRFRSDWPRLCKVFGWKKGRLKGAITGLRTGLSDRHRGGQTVAEFSLSTGDRIIYKPRSVRPEIAFNTFVNWLNGQGLPLRLKTVRALDCGTYGWMEVVSQRACKDISAVERFYTRAGMLLAILHVLAITDIHCENLIASGEHPVVVDLETLLSESPRRCVSVLDTGFLPLPAKTNKFAVDMSALGADERPDSELCFPIWRQINTDQMSISKGKLRQQEFHRVQMGDQIPTVAEHLSSFRQGFRTAYECLLANRRSLARNLFLKKFDKLELRVLLRNSITYGQLQLHLLHPEFLENALDRSLELEWLARPLCTRRKPTRGRLKLYELELAAMEQLDLPYFNTKSWKAMGHNPSSEEAKFFGGRRDSRSLRRRLTRLSSTACRTQLGLITRSIRLKYPTISR